MARATGGSYDDLEGLINEPLTVKSILAVVFFKEWEPGVYRVSLRSKGEIDVRSVAQQFGGGGHKNAAGCTVAGDLAAVRAQVVPLVLAAIERAAPANALMDGVLVVDKPEGPTSHDVVARCRRALRTPAIGHLGTLDPMATGVLVLVVGRATRLAQFLSGQPKSYDATFRLGLTTDTWDRTGTALTAPESSTRPERGRRGGRPDRLPGPPAADAAALLGEDDRGRPGPRTRPARQDGRGSSRPWSSCWNVELLAMDYPLGRLRLRSSAGYYVRSLVHDLGQALGCGACLEELRRTASGPFTLADALPLAAVEEDPGGAAGASGADGAPAARPAGGPAGRRERAPGRARQRDSGAGGDRLAGRGWRAGPCGCSPRMAACSASRGRPAGPAFCIRPWS